MSSRLGLAWFADLDTSRGQEATPIVIDGNLYTSTAWSMVKAYDGRTGRLIWSVRSAGTARAAAADLLRRGQSRVAAWGDTLFVGTLDGRLIALDRNDGQVLWSVVTVDQSQSYSITGRARGHRRRVIIGNGGAEFGVRGYVTAYDARDGHQLWRFFTVPGNPANGFEGEHLRRAAETWHGQWWRLGGGGTVWDSMAYDPELNLLYIGVGNGSPWNQQYRSEGQGDNLYLSSIVAIRPDTGEYVWHYQTTPGETWDFTATQHIILADLTSTARPQGADAGAEERLLLRHRPHQRPPHLGAQLRPDELGDRGRHATGRPIENPEARFYRTGRPFISVPGAVGAIAGTRCRSIRRPAWSSSRPRTPASPTCTTPTGSRPSRASISASTWARWRCRRSPRRGGGAGRPPAARLIAWDPVQQRERWRVQYRGPWNGGLLSTAGGLVFQGSAAGDFAASTPATAGGCGPSRRRPGRRRAGDLHDRRRAICRGDGRLGRGLGGRARHPHRCRGRCATSAGCSCSSWAGRHGCRRRAVHRRGRSTRPPIAARRRSWRRAARSMAASAASATATRR
jgi:alcohol dehydrogenase (cytochrome c)/quinohemoprotein ethanol dehydrogenase